MESNDNENEDGGGSRELIMISGESGTGKTVLVRKFQKTVKELVGVHWQQHGGQSIQSAGGAGTAKQPQQRQKVVILQPVDEVDDETTTQETKEQRSKQQSSTDPDTNEDGALSDDDVSNYDDDDVVKEIAFVMGKYNVEDQFGTPYSGISDACSQLCFHLINRWQKLDDDGDGDKNPNSKNKTVPGGGDGNIMNQLAKDLWDQLGEEPLRLLAAIIPELSNVLVNTEYASQTTTASTDLPATLFSSVSSNDNETTENSKAKFQNAITVFYRTICKYLPTIMILDDVQWADQPSMEVIEVLLSDSQNPTFFLICLSRSSNEDDNITKLKTIGQQLQQGEIKSYNINKANNTKSSNGTKNGQSGFDAGSKRQRQQQRQAEGADEVVTMVPSRTSLNTTCIETGPLSIGNVNELLIHVLDINNSDGEDDLCGGSSSQRSASSTSTTLPLAELIHRRTMGIPFMVVKFLTSCIDLNFISYDNQAGKWIWQANEILEKTVAMTNVVEVMKKELQQLPSAVQQKLVIAACLGNSFDYHTVALVENTDVTLSDDQSSEACSGTKSNDSRNWLAVAERNGFLECSGPHGMYQWIHDNVREGALSLVSSQDELIKLKGRIGMELWEKLASSEDELEDMVFDIANLLHGVSIPEKDTEKRTQLANLYLQAAKKAMHILAFDAAAKYAQRGIGLIPEKQRWLQQYQDMSLSLFSIAAEMERVTGDLDRSVSRYNTVKSVAGIPFRDQLDIHMTFVHVTRSYDPHGAISLCLNVLSKLGIKFPKSQLGRTFMLVRSLFKVKSICKSLTIEDLLSLPTMNDPATSRKISFLHMLGQSSYGTTSPKYQLFMPLAMLTTSLVLFRSRTVSSHTASNLAQLGIVFTGVFQDFELGKQDGYISNAGTRA